MKNFITLILVSLLFSSCDITINNPFENDSQKLYIIRKGAHFSNTVPEAHNGNKLTFRAKFNESAKYETTDPANQYDINKLMGFSDCGGHHHENSARFGWRWLNNELQILAYCYINGQRSDLLLGTTSIGIYSEYSLEKLDDSYIFTFDGHSVTVPRSQCNEDGNYLLFPYFGGNEKAPHDISIEVLTDES